MGNPFGDFRDAAWDGVAAQGSIVAVLKALWSRLATKTVGTHANAWNAAAVAINGLSAVIDVGQTPFVSAFGNVSAATTITLQYSQDGTNFYDGPNQVLSAAGDFRIDVTTGAARARLKSSAAVTATATIAGKG